MLVQGLIVSKGLYQTLGGFPPQVLLEDVEFLRRARVSTRIYALPMTLEVSARKFEDRGPLTYMAQCIVVLNLYIFFGWSPARLLKLYGNPAFLRLGKGGACAVGMLVFFLVLRHYYRTG